MDAEDKFDATRVMRSSQKGRVGRRIIQAKTVQDALVSIPARNRKTIRHASEATGVAVTTFWLVLKRGETSRMSNKLKPILIEQKQD